MARKSASVRRQDLVEAGLRVIAREGMHGATVRAIVAEAGVPLATFHYVFASRDEMIGEAYAYIAAIPDADGRRLPEGATVEDAVRASLEGWFARFLEHPEYEMAIMEIMVYCSRTPRLQHLPGKVQERYLEVAGDRVAQARATFGLVSAMSDRQVAALVLQITDGITYSWLRTRDTEAAHTAIDAAVPVLVRALAGTP